MREKRTSTPFVIVGILATIALHVGVVAVFWFVHENSASSSPLIGPGSYVDAQLVKFGHRDLTFLPHKEGRVKTVGPAEALKIATSENAPVRPDDKKEQPDKIDPLQKINAAMKQRFKPDDPEGFTESGIGDPHGSKAGTATEARGDPYILALIDVIGTAWTVPTTIKDSELAKLKAQVCLTINDAGVLTRFEFLGQRSGSSQFDSSLEAALGTIKKLPAPPPKWARAAQAGQLCPFFSKQ